MSVNNRKRGEIMKNNQKGFTLIELLVVIAIIGLLSTLAVVSLNGARAKARDARRMSDLKQISTAFELRASEASSYPTNGAAATACDDTPSANIVAAPDAPAAIDPLCGAGNAIYVDVDVSGGLNAGDQTMLASIPDDPIASDTYYYEGDGDNYCIAALLDDNTNYFVCVNGSCYKRGSNCTEAGL